jgi:hypothetical protein
MSRRSRDEPSSSGSKVQKKATSKQQRPRKRAPPQSASSSSKSAAPTVTQQKRGSRSKSNNSAHRKKNAFLGSTWSESCSSSSSDDDLEDRLDDDDDTGTIRSRSSTASTLRTGGPTTRLAVATAVAAVTKQSQKQDKAKRSRRRKNSSEMVDEDEDLLVGVSLPAVSPPPPINRNAVQAYEQSDAEDPDFAEITRFKNNKLLTTFIHSAVDMTEEFVASSYAAAVWCSQSFDSSSAETAHNASILLNKSFRYINNKKLTQKWKPPIVTVKRKKSQPLRNLRLETPIPVDESVMMKFCESEMLYPNNPVPFDPKPLPAQDTHYVNIPTTAHSRVNEPNDKGKTSRQILGRRNMFESAFSKF